MLEWASHRKLCWFAKWPLASPKLPTATKTSPNLLLGTRVWNLEEWENPIWKTTYSLKKMVELWISRRESKSTSLRPTCQGFRHLSLLVSPSMLSTSQSKSRSDILFSSRRSQMLIYLTLGLKAQAQRTRENLNPGMIQPTLTIAKMLVTKSNLKRVSLRWGSNWECKWAPKENKIRKINLKKVSSPSKMILWRHKLKITLMMI